MVSFVAEELIKGIAHDRLALWVMGEGEYVIKGRRKEGCLVSTS